MKTKSIRGEDIPEWEFGDVVIKRFSFGDKIRLANMSQTMSMKKEGGVEISERSELDAYTITMYTVAAGIHSVKKNDNYDFLIPPHTHVDEKLKVVTNDEFTYEAGEYLVKEIKLLNAGLTEDVKKKS